LSFRQSGWVTKGPPDAFARMRRPGMQAAGAVRSQTRGATRPRRAWIRADLAGSRVLESATRPEACAPPQTGSTYSAGMAAEVLDGETVIGVEYVE